MQFMRIVQSGGLLLSGALMLFTGCATLDVTQKKTLATTGEKQPVTLGIQASGDGRQDAHDTSKNPAVIGIEVAGERLIDALDTSEGSIVKTASGKLFEKVLLLPNESEAMQLNEIKLAYKVDYIMSVVIGDVTVSHNLNPIWFASFPMLFFKMYAPIVTFQPRVTLNVKLRDAATGAVLMQKQVMETSTDHFAPKNPRPDVRKLISLTINNAMVSIMLEAQQSIATARQSGK
jgi:hypothetical protein